MSNKSSINNKKQIIGNYLVGSMCSEWLAKEFNWIDFQLVCKTINIEQACVLRIIASYENYKALGNDYEQFKKELLIKR